MSFAADTAVPCERSQAEILQLLRRHQAKNVSCGYTDGEIGVAFTLKNRSVHIRVPMPTIGDAQIIEAAIDRRAPNKAPTLARLQAALDQEERRRWRCLVLSLRGKLESVETGIETFDVAFLAHIVVDSSGVTVYDKLRSSTKLLALPAKEDECWPVHVSRCPRLRSSSATDRYK